MDGQLVLVTTPNSITLQNMKNVLNLFNTRMLKCAPKKKKKFFLTYTYNQRNLWASCSPMG